MPTKDVVSEKFRYNVVGAAFNSQDAIIANIGVCDVVQNYWVGTILDDNHDGFSGLHVWLLGKVSGFRVIRGCYSYFALSSEVTGKGYAKVSNPLQMWH